MKYIHKGIPGWGDLTVATRSWECDHDGYSDIHILLVLDKLFCPLYHHVCWVMTELYYGATCHRPCPLAPRRATGYVSYFGHDHTYSKKKRFVITSTNSCNKDVTTDALRCIRPQPPIQSCYVVFHNPLCLGCITEHPRGFK